VATIRAARFPDDLAPVRALLWQYAANPDVAVCVEDFGTELSGLPGEYGPPSGTLIVAAGDDDAPIGCVALRRIDPETAEMKRLFLGPEARGQGLGRQLVEAIVDAGRALGYQAIRLDTLPTQRAAQGIYESLGFVDIPPYRHNPVAGTRFLELRLRS
jgi:ribosomal protein S18 acetylase RimI-like enzyme